MTESSDTEGTIAIVGMACRFPGAEDVDTFWSNLDAGRESISVFSSSQLGHSGVPDDVAADPDYVPAAGILDDVAGFDTDLFAMSPAEAAMVDPQQRLFLETVWRALEDAGAEFPDRRGRTSVFGATDFNTYVPTVLVPHLAGMGPVQSFQVEMGNANDFLTTRVAYKLDLRGAALTVQTACSASLVAVHMACEALLSGSCDAAVAGGSRIHLPQHEGHLHHAGGVSAAEPHCRPFDELASGTLRGNGVGVVVLKRTEDALRNGDHIYALVLGSAINNDGAGKVGFTAPSVAGQAAVIREALTVAGLGPADVSYVEAHGTGTALGDPIEFAALADALHGFDIDLGPCVLSAVKSNIGHLGSTAGVAGLIKAAKALENESIPGTLHFAHPNPDVPLDRSRFRISTESQPWPHERGQRVAGVSSFGIGGTNCHILLGDAPEPEPATPPDEAHLVVLSAASDTALAESRRQLAARLTAAPPPLADIARTLQIGRRALQHRWAGVAGSTDELIDVLGGGTTSSPDRAAPVVMVFPGQGAEYAGMARTLRLRYSSLAEDLTYFHEVLHDEVGLDLLAFLDTGAVPDGVPRTALVQPALFAIEHSLARLLATWGVRPTAVIGHSIGEFAAAALAGVFTPEAALRLTAHRGAVMARTTAGTMLAVRASEELVRDHLGVGVEISAVNAPCACVVGGPRDQVEVFRDAMQGRGVVTAWLDVDRPFHTSALASSAVELRSVLAGVEMRAPQLAIHSPVTGRVLSADEAVSIDYWGEQMTRPVRFADAVGSADDPRAVFLEVGPGQALASFVRQSLPGAADRVGGILGTGPATERRTLLHGLGALWRSGVDLDWRQAALTSGRVARLPTYPMQRRTCWFNKQGTSSLSLVPPAALPQAAEPAARPEAPVARAVAPPVTSPPRRGEGIDELLAGVLGVPATSIRPEIPLVEQGMDSLTLLQIAELIKGTHGVRLSLADLMTDTATPAALAAHLASTSTSTSTSTPARSPVPAVPETTPDVPTPDAPSAADPVTEPAPPPPEAHAAPGSGEVSPFGAAGAQAAASPELRAYLAEFVPRYVIRTRASQAANASFGSVHADPRNSAGFRDLWKEVVYPLTTSSAFGSRIRDLDDHEYVDLTMGFGSVMFGHGASFITEAIRTQLDAGFTVGPQSAMAAGLASQVSRLTGAERVAFTNSGTEAVMTAVRLARAVTGRDRVVVFRGAYHGHYDGLLARRRAAGDPHAVAATLGVPSSMVNDIDVLEYGSDEALSYLAEHGRTIAAVLVEPVQSRRPEFQPQQFLHDVRSITRAHGALLVLDEMITGFRAHQGGLNLMWGLGADLVTYGKVLGGGMPIGAVAGRAEVLDYVDGGRWQYGDDSRPESAMTFFAGTFCKHPLAMAAASAALTEMRRVGNGLQQGLATRAERLSQESAEVFARRGVPITWHAFGGQLYLDTSGVGDLGELVVKGLVVRGIYVWEGRTSFMSSAHDDADVDSVVAALDDTLSELVDARVLASTAVPPPVTPVRDEQALLWLGREMSPGATAAYNEIVTIPVNGWIDSDILRAAMNDLVARHEALRLSFDSAFTEQRARERVNVGLEVVDVGSGLERWAVGRAHVLEMLATNFDLRGGSLLRTALLRSDRGECVVVLVGPHLVIDGWSVDVLRSDLAALFTARYFSRRPALPPAPSFHEFVGRERELVEAERTTVDRYWRGQLGGIDGASFFTQGARGPRSYNARVLRQVLDTADRDVLHVSAASMGTTTYCMALAAWTIAIAATTGRTDVVIASAFAGQSVAGESALVGYCLKVLPQRIRISSGFSCADLVNEATRTVREVIRHWATNESRLIEQWWPGTRRDRPPFGGLYFDVERRGSAVDLPGTSPMDLDLAEVTYTKWDASAVLIDTGASLTAEVIWNDDIVRADEASTLLDAYVDALGRIIYSPKSPCLRSHTKGVGPLAGHRRPVPIQSSDIDPS